MNIISSLTINKRSTDVWRRLLTSISLAISITAISVTAISLSAMATTAPATQPQFSRCPGEFHNVVIHESAKQCQHFDTELPSSLVYFAAVSTDTLISYYLAQMPQLSLRHEHNQRSLLVNPAENIRVVVSPDDSGAQVDILVLDTPAATAVTSE